MNVLRTLTCVLALCTAMTASAQEPSMEPPAELKKLDFMLGEWSGKVVWTMPGMEGEMAMTSKSDWDGQFMRTLSVSEFNGIKMIETCYMGWDAKKGKYAMWTFTNFAPTPRIEYGTVEGTKFVSVSEPWEVGGMTMTGRATMTFKNGNKEADFTLEFKEGDKWNKVASGTLKKKG